MTKKISVLSLFDGVSCGSVALERAGIKVKNYYSSEIDKYALQISKKNYPDTIQLGDITKWKDWKLPKIDLILAGFPCQSWSVAGKGKGIDDPRGQLVLDLIDVWKHYKPKYFLFENVRMKKEFLDYMDNLFGVEHIKINSNLVSAQNRLRCYWTNIPNITQPKDKGILLKDIVHEFADTALSEKELGYMLRSAGKWSQSTNNRFEIYLNYPNKKNHCLTANLNKGVPYNCFFNPLKEYIVPFDKTLKILNKEVQKGKVGYFRKDSQANRVYFIHDKAITLCGDAGGGAAKMGQYLFGDIRLRVPEATKKGYIDIKPGDGVDLTFRNSKTRRGRRMKDKSNCLTAANYDYCLFGYITPDRINKRQNGQRFSTGKKFYTLTAQDKHGILIEGYIRKLTPIECCRLQTLPDLFVAKGINEKGEEVKISNSQQYKVIGNGWTIDAIVHMLKNIKLKPCFQLNKNKP